MTVVPMRLREMEAAYLARDFAAFGKLTMQDSNQFHATCLDTFPPIFYLNDVSKQIVHVVHRYNDSAGRVQAAYTFDAGPNAVVFVERAHVQELLSLLLHCFPPADRSASGVKTTLPLRVHPAIPDVLANKDTRLPHTTGAVQMYYVSGVGSGAKVLPASASLIDTETGGPTTTTSSGELARQQQQQRQRWLAAGAAVAGVVAAVWASRRR
jgi:diphosphomevalonate decarboxylase